MDASISFDGTLAGSIAGGGGGGGSEVTITPVLTQGTKIADFEIDSESGSLYAPEAGDSVEVTPALNSGDKVADISVNGVNKALYSQSYGYANDVHDTNSETIGGLQKGMDITPIKVKSVSYSDQSGAGSETIGVLSVGDTDYNIKQKKANVINYSITEQDTGRKWIDGRTVYQIVITGTTDNRIYFIPNTTDIDFVISTQGYLSDNSFNFNIPYFDGSDYITIGNSSSGVRIYTSNYFIGKTFVIILEYVKAV